MTTQKVSDKTHPPLAEREAQGREAATRTPPSVHAGWKPRRNRRDPVGLLEAQNLTREPDLVPVRHGRMLVSPFTFYRGAAAIMAADLRTTPTAGLDVQLCGDAHLSNFGLFASPERILLFDVNDFDETLPGPFEYDVKRMAASFTIAARNNGFSTADAREATLASVAAYREAMAGFARMRTIEVWYARLDEDQVMKAVHAASAEVRKPAGGKKADSKKRDGKKPDGKKRGGTKKETAPADVKLAKRGVKTAEKTRLKAHTRDSLQALSKLGEVVDGRYRIISQPPVLIPERELRGMYGLSAEEAARGVRDQFRAYRATLPDDRRLLLERFEIVDTARKVVGVGSVGTRAFIALLQGRDADDPLFLQAKEATASVLEENLGPSEYAHHGERVVRGQQLMQAASDIFLGWTTGVDVSRHFYWRQLRDMKGSVEVESMIPGGLSFYAGLCGWTLARAHARSGDPVAIAAYLGETDAFDRSVTEFAQAYAQRNEQDHEEFAAAVRSGRLEALEGV